MIQTFFIWVLGKELATVFGVFIMVFVVCFVVVKGLDVDWGKK